MPIESPLITIMKEHNLTNKAVANILDVTPRTVFYWKSSWAIPGIKLKFLKLFLLANKNN